MAIRDEHKGIMGLLNENGTFKKWPALNINGGRYSKPATTQVISDEYFVVLPAGFTDWDALKALKEQYGVVAPAVAPAPESFVDAPPAGDFTPEDTGIKRGKR